MRNRITGQLLKAFLNHKIKDFGKMTTLHIDTQEKRIQLTANLLGETEPIDASLKYTLEESDGRTFFVPTELTCSRQWLSLLAQQMLKDNVIRYRGDDGQGFDGLNRSRTLPMLKLFPVTGSASPAVQ